MQKARIIKGGQGQPSPWRLKRLAIRWFIVSSCVALDQVTKWLATEHLKGTEGVPLISGALRLQYLENSGIAFGAFQNRIGIFIALTIVAFVIIEYIDFVIPDEKKYFYLRLDMAILMAGALGNFIDRVKNGYVVDFIYVELINFPIFNLADCFVTISSILLFIHVLFYYKDEDFEFLKRKTSGKM